MNDKDFDDLLGLPSEEPPQELTIVEKDKNIPHDKNASRGLANRASIKQLYEEGYTYNEISKILKLSEICIKKHMKAIKESDLSNPDHISLASKALKHQLVENKSLEAVKMVYGHLNQDAAQGSNRGQTVININFDGLNNPSGKKIVSSKAAVYEDAVVIEATD